MVLSNIYENHYKINPFLPSLWDGSYGTNQNLCNFDKKNGKAIKANLDLLEDKQDNSQIKLTVYQKRMGIYFNSKVRKKYFKIGYVV